MHISNETFSAHARPSLAGIPALILCAGKSSRLGEFAGGLPKPLMPLAGQAVIAWNLRWVAAAGVRRVWVNVHHRAELIEQQLGSGAAWGVELNYSHEPELLGTAGAWKNLEHHWKGTTLIIYGDNFMRFDLADFLAAHRRTRALLTMAVFDPEQHLNTGGGGGHAVLDRDDHVAAFTEGDDKSTLTWINAGAYLIEPPLLDRIAAGFQDFGRDVLPRCAAAGELRAYRLQPGDFCLGIDTPERFARAEELIGSGIVHT